MFPARRLLLLLAFVLLFALLPASGASATTLGSAALDDAQAYLGTPYVFGGYCVPGGGCDCDDLVQAVYGDLGVYLDDNIYALYSETYAVSNPEPGDLVFYWLGGGLWHVGIYAGGGMVLNANSAAGYVTYSPLYSIAGTVDFRRVG